MNTLRTRYTLLERVKLSDKEAWEDFIEIYSQYMACLCYKMALPDDDVDEIVQRVVVKLWKKLPEYQSMKGGKFRSWLAKVTINEAKDYLKQKKIRKKHEKTYLNEKTIDSLSDDAEIDTLAEKEWHVYVVEKALQGISGNFSKKTIDIFRALMDGQSVAEVSKTFDTPSNTISVYKRRVTDALFKEVRNIENSIG
jgi:RNA polymerase sigma factor (sigma-70 family)